MKKQIKESNIYTVDAKDSLKISILTELFFAVVDGETYKYDEIANKLDGMKVPFKIQNAVSYAASKIRKGKSMDVSRVSNEVQKIYSKLSESKNINTLSRLIDEEVKRQLRK